MRRQAASLPVWCAVLASILTSCSEGGWRRTPVPAGVADAIQGDREITTLPPTDTLQTVTEFKLPASLSSFYKMSFPIALAAVDSPTCWLAVGDVVDRAVHVFDLHGKYLFSFFGGGRENAVFGGLPLSSVSASRENSFLVSTTGGRVIEFGPGGRERRAETLQRPVEGGRSLSNQIQRGPDGLIYSHWFVGEETTVTPAGWTKDSSLVRLYDESGGIVGRMGHVTEYLGTGLTQYLNRGVARIFADTLWFARRADARVFAFPLGASRTQPARVVDLPVFFRADTPIEYTSDDSARVAIRIQEHIRAFAVSRSGEFYLIQNTSWPSMTEKTKPFVPRSVISVVDRTGRLKRTLQAKPSLINLLAVAGGIIAIVSDHGTISVVALKDPGARREASC